MQHRYWHLIFLFTFLFIQACNFHKVNQEIILIGIFSNEKIKIAVFEDIENFRANIFLEDRRSNDSIFFSIPEQKWAKASKFYLPVYQDSTITLCFDKMIIKNVSVINAKNISSVTWLKDLSLKKENKGKQDIYIMHPGNNEAVIVFFPPLFYQSRPIGLQLFLRLSFCATLLFLIAFLFKQSSSQRLLLSSIAFFLACLPLQMEWSNWTLGVMGGISILAFILDKERKFRWQPIFWVPVAIYAFYLLGCLYAEHKADAYKELDSSVAFLIFPVIFSIIQLKRENINLLLRFFIRVMMIFCIFGLISYATIVPEFTWNMAFRDSKLYAPLLLMWPAFPHPSVTAMVLAMAVPVAIYLRYQAKNTSMVEMLLCLCLIMIFSMLTGARVAMIVVPLLIGLGFLFYSRIRPIFKWIMMGMGVLGCIWMLQRYPGLETKFSDPIREQLRETAMDRISQKPVFGWGTGSMRQIIASEETAHRLGYEAPQDVNHFHNQYLDMAVQYGIPGILLILGLLGWCLVLAFKNKDFLLLAFVVMYGIFMIVESPFTGVKTIQPMMFWLCFFVATQKMRYNDGYKLW